jgi:hypothetical protein
MTEKLGTVSKQAIQMIGRDLIKRSEKIRESML